MKEIKEVTGDIQNVRKDLKAVQLNNDWYSSFIILDDFEKGDHVKIQYQENTKDGKTFLNIKKIEIVDLGPELIQGLHRYDFTESTLQIPDTTMNTMIMTIKEIHIDSGKPLKEITKEVMEIYLNLKNLK